MDTLWMMVIMNRGLLNKKFLFKTFRTFSTIIIFRAVFFRYSNSLVSIKFWKRLWATLRLFSQNTYHSPLCSHFLIVRASYTLLKKKTIQYASACFEAMNSRPFSPIPRKLDSEYSMSSRWSLSRRLACFFIVSYCHEITASNFFHASML